MRLNNLEVTFHRTVRVAEGRAASNLPPSLGRMKMFKVSDYRKNCPADWDDSAFFMSLHDTEAMWLSFHAIGKPCAVLVGAGGVNALSGQKLGTKLEKENYLVCPPQPWIDGWKDVDGTVHQFIATPHKKGEGLTVAEQIIGAESKTGAMGLAIFEPKDDAKLKTANLPGEWNAGNQWATGGIKGQSVGGNTMWASSEIITSSLMSFDHVENSIYSTTMDFAEQSVVKCAVEQQQFTNSVVPKPAGILRAARAAVAHVEMGLGKGGKIIQKIYGDPHGIEVWKETPTVVFAFYLVDAKTAEEITGEKVAGPVDHAQYGGAWFGLHDEKLPDVLGTSIFSGLKSAAFTGDTSNVEDEKSKESVPVEVKAGA